jgi:GT2 family glycosyltransferase
MIGRIAAALRHYRRYGPAATLRKTAQALGAHWLARLFGYRLWLWDYGRTTRGDKDRIRAHIARLARRPVVSLIVRLADPAAPGLDQTVRSLNRQLYPHWEAWIVGGPAPDCAAGDRRIRTALNAEEVRLAGDVVAFVDPADELSELALYMIAVAVSERPEADLIYTDEDRIDPKGRLVRPYFKPDWNLDLFYGRNYIDRLCAVRRPLTDGVPCPAGDYDFLLRLVERLPAGRIHHIPHVLYHRRGAPSGTACPAILAGHFARCGVPAAIEEAPATGRNRVRYPLPHPPPLVSVIVPTRDQVDLLRQCVDGLLNETDYSPIEIIIVDNGSREPAAIGYLAELARRSVHVLRYDAPFNYAAINNFAVRHAAGEVLTLLNNDIKVRHAGWLDEMVRHALRPDIGAVGAKLYYPDGTLQHAGVVTGLGGVAGHLHLGIPATDTGNYDDVNLVREVTCVTAACMVLRRSVFAEAGGLDEIALPVAFNDVDLCLRIRAKGYRIVWTPFAELTHFESASRGSDLAPDKIARFRREHRTMTERWGDTLERDPFYSPNLSLDGCQGELAFPPRVAKPWRARRKS